MLGKVRKPRKLCLLGLCAALSSAALAPAHAQGDDRAVEALEQRVAALENELAVQRDIEAIRALQYTYGYYMDQQLYSQVVALWSRDPVSVEIGGGGVLQGREGVLHRYNEGVDIGPVFGFLREHLQLQGVIHVSPDRTSAKGRFRAIALVSMKPNDPEGQGIQLGLYENEYVQEDGVWKISKLDYKQIFTAPYLEGWSASPMYSDCAWPQADAPTTWYHPYPEAGVFPFHYPNPVTGEQIESTVAPGEYWQGNWPGEFGECGTKEREVR